MGKPVELKAVLIAPDRELAGQFCRTLPETRAFQIVADLKRYPTDQTLEIRLRQFQPEVVLLDVASDLEAACALIRRLASLRPPMPVIGLDAASRPEVVMRVLRIGASEYFAAPFEAGVLREAVAAIVRLRRPQPSAEAEPGKVIAFASAKPGSGASTLASQTAFALQRLTGKRVLLADLDMAAGTAGFYAGVRGKCSFLEALDQAERADPSAWASLTDDCRGVDVLAAPATPREMPLDAVRFRQVLDQARGLYAWTLLDLPAIFHRVSLLALAGADRTFLMATTELPSLHLARKAVRLFAEVGLDPDRFELVINQVGRREGMSGQQLEKILGCPVRIWLPDDHPRLHQAVARGESVDPACGFGEAVEGLAGRMAGASRGEKRKVDLFLNAGPAYAGT
jgi:pilus assembly protein CpaE